MLPSTVYVVRCFRRCTNNRSNPLLFVDFYIYLALAIFSHLFCIFFLCAPFLKTFDTFHRLLDVAASEAFIYYIVKYYYYYYYWLH